MSHGKIPMTAVHQKQTRFDELVGRICQFIAVAERARVKLRQEKRISPQLDFKLVTEMSFARGIVIHMGSVPQVEYVKLIENVQSHPDFDKSVETFCNDVSPQKSLLVTPDEFAREQMQAKALGNVAPPNIRGLRG